MDYITYLLIEISAIDYGAADLPFAVWLASCSGQNTNGTNILVCCLYAWYVAPK
jgi:hypothetical protein